MEKGKKFPAVSPEKIHILDFRIFKAKFETSEDYLNDPVNISGLHLDRSCDHALDVENDLIGIRVYVFMRGLDENGEELGVTGDFGIEFFFNVDDLESMVEERENSREVSGILIKTLSGIAYSTTRGLVYDQLKGTPLQGFLLPVVDPGKLLDG